MVIVIASVVFGGVIFMKNKDEIFYGETRATYTNHCQTQMKKSMIMSGQKRYSSCDCSYKKVVSLLGKGKMKRFTGVILENDRDLTNSFLRKEEVNVKRLDSYFLSCF